MVKMATGRKIPIWRTFIFPNQKKLYLSSKLRFVDKICFFYRFWTLEQCNDVKYNTGSSTAAPRQPSWNCILHHYSAADGPIGAKFENLFQTGTQITAIWSKSQREEFQYGGRLFSKPEVVVSQPWIKICLQIDFDLWKKMISSNTKPEVVLDHRYCHLEIVYYYYYSAAGGPILEIW